MRRNHQLSIGLLALLAICSFFYYTAIHPNSLPVGVPSTSSAPTALKVNFIDVGQADCILIQTPEGKNMLIDAGTHDAFPKIQTYFTAVGVSKLDVVIGTHPHEDHIGSMAQVITTYPTQTIYLPKVSTTTATFRNLLIAVKAQNLTVTPGKAGIHFDLGTTVKVDFLAPNRNFYEDLNNYSIVTKLTYGKTTFLLVGDAQRESEQEMLAAGYSLQADVLKVGHHGSNSSSTPKFIKAVTPKYAVIMVGQDNPYHHPHKQTIQHLSAAGIKTFRTDLNGDIVASSDGNTITFTTTKGTP